MKYGFSDLVNLVVSQSRGFIEVLRLKLRILGFSNKRSGLMTRLGEAAFKAIEAGSSISDDAEALKHVEEIREAGVEIANAENEINSLKEKGNEERRGFQEKGSQAKGTDTSQD